METTEIIEEEVGSEEETAEDVGSADETAEEATMTASEHERQVRAALDSARSNWDKKQENDRLDAERLAEDEELRKSKSYKQLYEKEAAKNLVYESDKQREQDQLSIKAMTDRAESPEFYDVVKNLPVEEAKKQLDTLLEIVGKKAIDKNVQDAASLKAPRKGNSKSTTNVEDMSDDEYIAWKKDNNYF